MSVALGIAALFVVRSQAHAVSMLDFGVIAPTTGSISYAGGMNPLVGTNIQVDNIVGLPGGTTLTCVGCVLNFTTGNLTGTTGTTWDFGGGPATSITVTGTAVDSLNNVIASGALLTGGFGMATVTNFANTFKIAGASFTDVKDPNLLAFFGLPTGIPYNGNFNISFMGTGTPPGAFASSTVLSGDIVNTPTPEPGTMLLLGSGLAGFGYLARRRRRQAS